MALLSNFLESRARHLPSQHPSEGGWWTRRAGGMEVNDQTALGNTAVLSALTIASSTLGALPLHVMRRNNADRERDRRNPLHKILAEEPNPEMTAPVFWMSQYLNKMARGNQVAEIELDNGGRPKYLWPIETNRVRAARVYKRAGGGLTENSLDSTPEDRRRGGTINYEVTGAAGTTWLPSRATFHVPDHVNFDGLWAKSRIQVAAEAIGIGLARQKYQSSTYAHGAVPPIAIKRPAESPPLGPTASKNRLKAWEADHGGPWRAGRTALLQEGEELVKMSFTPEEAQMIDAAQFNVLDISRIFNIPPHLLSHLVEAHHSNIEQQWIEYVTIFGIPHIRTTEAELKRKLFAGQAGFAEYAVEGLLRGDSESRGKFYKALWELGAITSNEIRRRENLPRMEGGDRTYVPLNYATTDQASDPAFRSLAAFAGRNEQRTAPAIINPVEQRAQIERRSIETRRRLRTSFRSLLEEAIGRVVTREAAKIRRRLPATESAAPDDFLQWLSGFYSDHRGYVARVVGPVLTTMFEAIAPAAAEEVGAEFEELRAQLETAADQYRQGYARRYVHGHEKRLRGLISGAGWAAAIGTAVEAWTDRAASQETSWEIVKADSAASKAIYRAVGRTRTRWVFNGGDCPICPPLHGRIVTIGQPYLSPGDSTPEMNVRRVIDGPPAHTGCECSEVAD